MAESIQRREDRTEVSWIAVIRLPDGGEIPCSVKDVSTAGMKVCVPEEQPLPDAFMLKILGRELVFRVRKAWRRQHHVGVLIDGIAKLPPTQDVADGDPGPGSAGERHSRLGARPRFRSNL